MTEPISLRLTITGRVQGVGYRAWAIDMAAELGLAGWVRNRRDGSVEILAHGRPDAVEALVRACRDGPRFARVLRVERHPADPGMAPRERGFHQVDTV